MRRFLFVLCGLSFLMGIYASFETTSVVQYIVAGVALLSAAILMVGAAIVNSLDKLIAEFKKRDSTGI